MRTIGGLVVLAALMVGQLPAQASWRYLPREQPVNGVALVPFAVADINGDGYVDYLSHLGYRIWCGLGRAPTGFGPEYVLHMHVNNSAVKRVIAEDVDGDGDRDILLLRGGTGSTSGDPLFVNSMLINDGAGHFTDETAQRWPTGAWPTMDAVIVDVNADGVRDIVECNWDRHRLYLGQPGGTFVDVTTTHMPVRFYGWQVAAGDIDGDGSVDLIFVAGWTNGGFDIVYLNDGTGHFTDHSYRLPGRSYDRGVSIGDIDGDGDKDIALAVYGNGGVGLPSYFSTVFRNDGSGFFTEDATSLGIGAWPGDTSQMSFMLDIDHDGDLDIIFWGFGPRKMFRNDGTGHFLDVTHDIEDLPPNVYYSLVWVHPVDVDHDGDLDLVHGYDGSSYLLDGVHVVHSLTQHLSAPNPPSIGQSYVVELDGLSGGFGMLGVSFGWMNLQVPPYGMLRLDLGFYTVWPSFAFLGPNGRGTLTIPVPNLPAIVGLDVYLQGLVTSKAGGALRLTNLLHDRIQ